MKFRKHFDYDVRAASDEATVVNDGPSLTDQSMARDADINVLMERMKITGQMPTTVRLPTFDDFTGVRDFQSALNSVIDASEKFGELPPKLRQRFNNDPQEFLVFVSDSKNEDEMAKLGLLNEAALARRQKVLDDAEVAKREAAKRQAPGST